MANLNEIPFFIQASTKEKLVQLMFLNNKLNGTRFSYYSPILEGKNWVVWFLVDISSYKKIDESILSGTKY